MLRGCRVEARLALREPRRGDGCEEVRLFEWEEVTGTTDSGVGSGASQIDVDNFFGIIVTVQELFCGGRDGNPVSATAQINVDASPENLARAIRFRLGKVSSTGLTVFPKASRPLVPYEEVTKADYESALAAGLAQVNGD